MASQKPQSGLRLKLTSFLSKAASNLKQAATDVLCIALMVCGTTMFVSRMPEMHDAYLRYKVGTKVYKIQAELNGDGGTGFQLKAPSGTNYVVTNSHVCEAVQNLASAENKQTALVVDDEGHSVRRRIVAISDETDLCLIEGMPGVNGLSTGSEPGKGSHATVVGHPHLRPLTLAGGEIIGSEDVEIMDYVMSVEGNPFVAAQVPTKAGKCDQPKNDIKDFPIPEEIGGGTAKVCFVDTQGAYMTSITIYPGNSGSPMVSWRGDVIGVVFAANPSDNYGDAVSLKD